MTPIRRNRSSLEYYTTLSAYEFIRIPENTTYALVFVLILYFPIQYSILFEILKWNKSIVVEIMHFYWIIIIAFRLPGFVDALPY